MNKTAEELLRLKKEMEYVPNLDGVTLEMAVANFDADKARAEIGDVVVGEIWDRKSPINGVSAEDVMEIHEIGETGSVFIVREGDQVIQLQPHDPDEPGFVEMNGSRSKSLAKKAAEEHIENRIDGELRKAIVREASK